MIFYNSLDWLIVKFIKEIDGYAYNVIKNNRDLLLNDDENTEGEKRSDILKKFYETRKIDVFTKELIRLLFPENIKDKQKDYTSICISENFDFFFENELESYKIQDLNFIKRMIEDIKIEADNLKKYLIPPVSYAILVEFYKEYVKLDIDIIKKCLNILIVSIINKIDYDMYVFVKDLIGLSLLIIDIKDRELSKSNDNDINSINYLVDNGYDKYKVFILFIYSKVFNRPFINDIYDKNVINNKNSVLIEYFYDIRNQMINENFDINNYSFGSISCLYYFDNAAMLQYLINNLDESNIIIFILDFIRIKNDSYFISPMFLDKFFDEKEIGYLSELLEVNKDLYYSNPELKKIYDLFDYMKELDETAIYENDIFYEINDGLDLNKIINFVKDNYGKFVRANSEKKSELINKIAKYQLKEIIRISGVFENKNISDTIKKKFDYISEEELIIILDSLVDEGGLKFEGNTYYCESGNEKIIIYIKPDEE